MRKRYPIEKYGAVFDAHTHTYFDYHDGLMSPDDLINATIKWGYNFVMGMAHDTIRGFEIIKRKAKEKNLPAVCGIEISTIHNHLLAYGVQEWKYTRNTIKPEDAIDELRAQDCAIFLSHPYSSVMGVEHGYWSPELIKRLDIDGIEWCNATTYILNKKTRKVYHNFPHGRRIAGTDSHHPSTFGYAFTQVDINSNDPDDLIASMKRGKCKAYSNNVPIGLAIYMLIKSIAENKIIKRKKIEGRWIKPKGDRPLSILPKNFEGPFIPYDELSMEIKNERHKKWLNEFLKREINPKTANWVRNGLN